MKLLRFIGAVIVALLFDYIVRLSHIAFFAGATHLLANLTWSNWLGFDILRASLVPVVWGILGLLGFGLSWLVRSSKIIAALPIVIFISGVIYSFANLFLYPIEMIVDDIGQGVWYYLGATVTFFFMLVCYVLGSIAMFGEYD